MLPGILGVRNQTVLICSSGLPDLNISFRYVVRSGSLPGILVRIALPTGSKKLDCSGVKTKTSTISVFFLIG